MTFLGLMGINFPKVKKINLIFSQMLCFSQNYISLNIAVSNSTCSTDSSLTDYFIYINICISKHSQSILKL